MRSNWLSSASSSALMEPAISVAVEGSTDEAIAKRLCADLGIGVRASYVKNGKSLLDRRLSGYNQAARHGPWFVMRDLNGDAACAPTLVADLVPRRSPNLILRIPVKASEAWLLADVEGLSRYLRVRGGQIPPDPEAIRRPKRALVSVAARSRDPAVKADMLPRPRTGREVGVGYTYRMIDFVFNHWSPERASERSDSLARCMRALKAMR